MVTSRAPIRVCHVTTSLETGGAELMLEKLIASRASGATESVISLRGEGTVGPRLAAQGVAVRAIGLGTVPGPAHLLRLRAAVRASQPDVLVGWMYHGNLAAWAGRRWAPEARLVWGIRNSFMGFAVERPLTRPVIRLGAALSRRTDAIIYNSAAGARQHQAIGFDAARGEVIPNGFDLERFKPDPDARAWLRGTLGVGPDEFLVGQVARFHPMKNQVGLLRAAGRAAATGMAIRVVMAGSNIEGNAILAEAARISGMTGRVHFLDERADVQRIMAGIDVLCSPSLWGEAFPNVVGEAMACGVPCIVTDVGDSAAVVGDTGTVVPHDSESGLAEALATWAARPAASRRDAGHGARVRVASAYSLEVIARTFYDRLAAIAGSPSPQRGA